MLKRLSTYQRISFKRKTETASPTATMLKYSALEEFLPVVKFAADKRANIINLEQFETMYAADLGYSLLLV